MPTVTEHIDPKTGEITVMDFNDEDDLSIDFVKLSRQYYWVKREDVSARLIKVIPQGNSVDWCIKPTW